MILSLHSIAKMLLEIGIILPLSKVLRALLKKKYNFLIKKEKISVIKMCYKGKPATFKMLLSLIFNLQRCATPWPVACQAPLTMEFSRQEY